MRFVKTVKTVFTAVSVVLIAAGAALLVWPDASASLICGAMGVVAILAGAVRLAGYFSNDLYRLAFQFDLAVGVLSILLGGILLGVIETFAKAYISTDLSDAVVFAVLIIVLLVRPAGLLGKYVPEKV